MDAQRGNFKEELIKTFPTHATGIQVFADIAPGEYLLLQMILHSGTIIIKKKSS